MKSKMIMTIIGLATASLTWAQINNPVTGTVKVFGNCSICKAAIEKAGTSRKLYKTEWDTATKMAVITIDLKQTTTDAVLKNIALAGYDNAAYLAPDDVYDKLPACCKYERTNKTAALPVPGSASGNTAPGDHSSHGQGSTVNQESSLLKTVFDNYFSLKDALVKSDARLAAANATALLSSLDKVDMNTLKDATHSTWMKTEKSLKSAAQQIRDNKDISQQRGYFITLSSMMYELVKAARPDEVIYYQHCPMANDGKGANWLSRESNIRNPFYGSSMLTCGKTIETIRP